jgi:hypothetical protein
MRKHYSPIVNFANHFEQCLFNKPATANTLFIPTIGKTHWLFKHYGSIDKALIAITNLLSSPFLKKII